MCTAPTSATLGLWSTAGLIHYLLAISVTDSNKIQELHVSVGRKIVLNAPWAPYSLFLPESLSISPCFAWRTHTCPVSVVFTAHSQSKSHGLLQFTSNSSRNLHIIYFLWLTRVFPPPPCSVSQLTTAYYSTSPEIQSFYLTRLIRFLHCPHPVLHWYHLYYLLSPSSHTARSVFYWI